MLFFFLLSARSCFRCNRDTLEKVADRQKEGSRNSRTRQDLQGMSEEIKSGRSAKQEKERRASVKARGNN